MFHALIGVFKMLKASTIPAFQADVVCSFWKPKNKNLNQYSASLAADTVTNDAVTLMKVASRYPRKYS